MLAKLNTLRRRLPLFLMALYGVELLDELIYGLHSAVVPYFKTDLALTYTQVGLLFTAPALVGVVCEPLVGLLGDTRHRKRLVMGGIVATVLGLFMVALGQTFGLLLLAFCILGTASGAYVNLAQATVIDLNPDRAEQTMARWVLLGAIGAAVAPLVATAAFYFGYGWRGLYWALAGMAGVYAAALARISFNNHAGASEVSVPVGKLWRALTSPTLLRWLLLTEMADFMLDKLLEVTGLYFHDVAGASLAAASGAAALFTVAGLAGDALLVPLLERVSGLRVLRISAVVVLAAYASFLLAPVVWVKYPLIAVVSFSTAGWYSTLRAKSYQALPGQSGVAVAAGSIANIFSLFVPLAVGRLADAFGLQWAMWLLAVGPLALIVGLPGEQTDSTNSAD